MSEIKRYNWDICEQMVEDLSGEWVRWEDVRELLKPRRMTYEEIAEAIRLVQEPLDETGHK
jgi:hypothetical protein